MGVESVADMLYCRSLRNDQTKQLLVEYHTASCHPACYLKVIINHTGVTALAELQLNVSNTDESTGRLSYLHTSQKASRFTVTPTSYKKYARMWLKSLKFSLITNLLHLYKDFINKLSEPKLNIQTLISVQ